MRHLNQMRSLYKLRHDCLINYCKSWTFSYLMSGENAGLHIIVHIKDIDEVALVKKAQKKGLRIYHLGEYTHSDMKVDEGLVLGFGGLDKDRIHQGMKLLTECIVEMGSNEISNNHGR